MSKSQLPSLWISGRIPSKKNSKRIVTRGKRPILLSSKDYLSWEKQAILEIKVGWEQGKIIKCESITYRFSFPDNRVRDLSNSVEGVNDALVMAGVLKDDKWQITGDLILKGSIACNKSEVGVSIDFKGCEYE